jgi:general secretion pathway protein J
MRGFTLVEVMVAIGIMALMAMLSWRGLDGMTRSQATTQAYADEVLTLQTGLAQWGADLDAMLQLQPAQQINAIDWDGRALRLTRRSSNTEDNGLLVVAWTRRVVDGGGLWLRWQSPPLRSRAALTEAWQRAGQWAQNPGDEEKKREVAITPLDQWQIFYFRNDAWSNPLSSDGLATPTASPPPGATGTTIPEGLRLVLTLPAGSAVSGTLTRDWVAPTVGGGK